MVESFKNTSRLVTVIMALITMLSMITLEQWETILPTKYVVFAPMLVTGITFLANQYSEEKRVTRAEELIHEEYNNTEDDEFTNTFSNYDNGC